MKKHFYSIWFRIVLAFFWVMVFTCCAVGLSVHLITRLNLWRYVSFPLTSLHFIILLALISIVFGSLISMFALHHVLKASIVCDTVTAFPEEEYALFPVQWPLYAPI